MSTQTEEWDYPPQWMFFHHFYPSAFPIQSQLSLCYLSTVPGSPQVTRRLSGFGNSPQLITPLPFWLLCPSCSVGASFWTRHTHRPSDTRDQELCDYLSFHYSSLGVWPHPSITWWLTVIQHFRHLHDHGHGVLGLMQAPAIKDVVLSQFLKCHFTSYNSREFPGNYHRITEL